MPRKRIIPMSWYDLEFGVLLPQRILRQRGWTVGRINKLLGEPDCLGINPRGSSKVLLYSERRVRRAEFLMRSGGNPNEEAKKDDAQ